MKLKFVAGLITLPLLLGAAPKPETKSNRRDGLPRQKLAQERIGTTLDRVSRQLDSIIAEYDRNELEGDDVEALKRFRTMLTSLAGSQVKQIVDQLEKAHRAQDDAAKANNSALDAFSSQKIILAQLNKIYLEWELQQIFRELSNRFMRLSFSQRNNMLRAVETVKQYSGLIPRNAGETLRIDLRIQELDQTGINDEAAALVKILRQLDKKHSPYIEPRPNAALKLVKSDLNPALEAAIKEIQDVAKGAEESSLEKAALTERSARNTMIKLARLLAPKRDDEEVIRQAIQDIEQAIGDQENIQDDTTALKDDNDPRPEDLGRAQADLVDRTDFIREDVADIVPSAAQDLGESTDSQQQARGVLSDTSATPAEQAAQAPPQQQEALESFVEAKEALEEALEALTESGEGEDEGEVPDEGGGTE